MRSKRVCCWKKNRLILRLSTHSNISMSLRLFGHIYFLQVLRECLLSTCYISKVTSVHKNIICHFELVMKHISKQISVHFECIMCEGFEHSQQTFHFMFFVWKTMTTNFKSCTGIHISKRTVNHKNGTAFYVTWQIQYYVKSLRSCFTQSTSKKGSTIINRLQPTSL